MDIWKHDQVFVADMSVQAGWSPAHIELQLDSWNSTDFSPSVSLGSDSECQFKLSVQVLWRF